MWTSLTVLAYVWGAGASEGPLLPCKALHRSQPQPLSNPIIQARQWQGTVEGQGHGVNPPRLEQAQLGGMHGGGPLICCPSSAVQLSCLEQAGAGAESHMQLSAVLGKSSSMGE